MKIEGHYTNDYRNLNTQKSKISGREKSANQATSPAIQLSDTAKKIRETTDMTSTASTSKVAAIKQAIQDGTYEISAEKIAASMFNVMKEG